MVTKSFLAWHLETTQLVSDLSRKKNALVSLWPVSDGAAADSAGLHEMTPNKLSRAPNLYMYRHWSIFNALQHTRLRGIGGNFIQRKSGFFPYSEFKKNYSFSNKDAEII